MSKTHANDFLSNGIRILSERGKQYDKDDQQQERSMQKVVKVFNEICGKDLTEAEGWEFMALVKQVRAFSRPGVYHEDSWQDGVNYLALGGEAASKEAEESPVRFLTTEEQIAYQGYLQACKSKEEDPLPW